VLQSVMEDRLRELGIAVQFGKRLRSISDLPGRPVVVHFEDGTEAVGDCVIGADGIGSRLRKIICPEAPGPAYTGLLAVIGFCPCAEAEDVTAGSEQRVHLVFGRHSFFEYVNILTPEGPRTVWWSTAETPMPSREQMASEDIEAVRERLLALHQGWGEPVQRLLQSAYQVVQLPISEVLQVPRWSAGRALILGDAAHAIGPHSGQASAMALEDSMLLAQLMASATKEVLQTPGRLQQVFQALESQRLERLERVLAISQRAAGRKQEMTRLRYWWMQQQMRVRVPIGSRKPKGWLLDHRVGAAEGS
jgi:2-polyprenyl-6-methoxyphenol hydroxylase-like FAD-dependent oxidoreductase